MVVSKRNVLKRGKVLGSLKLHQIPIPLALHVLSFNKTRLQRNAALGTAMVGAVGFGALAAKTEFKGNFFASLIATPLLCGMLFGGKLASNLEPLVKRHLMYLGELAASKEGQNSKVRGFLDQGATHVFVAGVKYPKLYFVKGPEEYRGKFFRPLIGRGRAPIVKTSG
ncbi:MAG: hypothetical protein Q8R15_01355 [Candidatus Micrarchaeota archaeon]|nr:hypothetical protein [Candidatus Micrarchaeota archaeon]